jgi:transient receptor potential cation channel subfamily M protein 2
LNIDQTRLKVNDGKRAVNDDEYDDFLWTTFDENEPDTLESNHSHFLLLDDGTQGKYQKTATETDQFYIDDKPRSELVGELKTLTDCDTVTIIVEGGLDSLGVIENDLKNNRPVVIIHGSGRLATAIANLIELTRSMITVRYFKR